MLKNKIITTTTKGEPSTRPPGCTTPQQPTKYNDKILSMFEVQSKL